jgi:hypothetical protein
MSLVPLPDGDLLAATAAPWLGRLRPDGTAAWTHRPPPADFRAQFDKLSVSDDGRRIGFGFAAFGKQLARFDRTALALALDLPGEARMAAPRQNGLDVEHWLNEFNPTLDGQPRVLDGHERSRSLAVDRAKDRFVWAPRGAL